MAKVLDKDFVKLDGSITVKTAVDEVKSIADKNIKISAYYNVLAAEAIWQFLNDNDFVNCEPHNLRASAKFLSEFEVSDIQLPNLSVYVRAVYDEDLLFVPKKHFINKITPDVYLFVKIDDKLESGEVLGYVYPEQINKKNDNGQYYFVNRSFLKPFSELLSLIKNKEIKEQYLITDRVEETLEKFIMLYMDHDIDNLKFEKLIEYLKNSSVAREKLIEFENFEKLSYMAFKEFENLDVDNNSFSKYIKSLVSVDEFSNFGIDDMNSVIEEAPQAAGLFIDDDLVQDEVSGIEEESVTVEEDILQEDESLINEDQIAGETEISDVTEEIKEPEYKDEFDIFDNPDDDGFDSEDLLLNPEIENAVSTEDDVLLQDDETLIPSVTDEDIVSGTLEEQIDFEDAGTDVVADNDELRDADDNVPEISEEVSDDIIPEAAEDEIVTDEAIQLTEDEDLVIDTSETEISDEVQEDIIPEVTEDVAVMDDTVQLTEDEDLVIATPEMEISDDVSDEILPEITENDVVTDEVVQLADDEEVIIDSPEVEISDEVKEDVIPEVTEDVAVSDDEVQLSDGDDIVLDDIQLDIGLEEGEEKQKSEPEVSEDIVISDDAEMDIDEAMSGQVFEDEELSDLDFVTDAQVDNVIGEANMEIEEPTVNFVSDEEENPVSDVVVSDEEPVLIADEEDTIPQEASDVVLEDDEDIAVTPVPEQEDESSSEIDDILADITGGYSDTDISDIAASIGKSSGIDLNDIYSADSNNQLSEALAPAAQAEAVSSDTSDTVPERDFAFAFNQSGGMSKKLVAGVASAILILCIVGIGAWFMLSHNKSSVANNVPADKGGNAETPDINFDNTSVEQNQDGTVDMSDIQTDIQVPAQPAKLDDDSKAPALTIQKIKKDFSQPDSYLSVNKIIWDVPEYMTYNDEFNNYLQTVGNSLKVNISSDLLLINENPIINSIKLKISLKNNGTTVNVDITQGCGAKTIDDLVLQSVKKTMGIIKPPASGIETADEDLYLTICL